MVTDIIRLGDLTMEELAGVVSIYPWFSRARVELCRRMAAQGGWDEERFASEALYTGDRREIFDLFSKRGTFEDKDPRQPSGEVPAQVSRDVVMLGGDYFSKEQYRAVKVDADDTLTFSPSKSAAPARSVADYVSFGDDDSGFCTETLARIYLSQGLADKAKDIYSRLMLRYPEKSAYFAAQIEKTENKI